MGKAMRSMQVGLSEQAIVDVALELIAEGGGVEELSMRQLSARLGVSLGAAYRHVATKEDLLALCGRELFRRALRPRLEGADPVAWVREQMVTLYDTVCTHPGMAAYIVQRIDVTGTETVDAVRDALLAAGHPAESEGVVRFVLTFYLAGVLLAGPTILAAVGAPDPHELIAAGLDYLLLPAEQSNRRTPRLLRVAGVRGGKR
jgi:AcrR family transcriptional regulator